MIAGARAEPARPPLLGVMAFAAVVAMLFVAFTAAMLIRRAGSDWEPIPLPGALAAGTAVLVLSSASVEAARRRRARGWLAGAILLGLAFLGLQGAAWTSLAAAGVLLPTSPHASFFYVLSGLHGLHLAGGLVALGLAAADRLAVAPAAFYWHFMGGVWLYVYLVLRLL